MFREPLSTRKGSRYTQGPGVGSRTPQVQFMKLPHHLGAPGNDAPTQLIAELCLAPRKPGGTNTKKWCRRVLLGCQGTRLDLGVGVEPTRISVYHRPTLDDLSELRFGSLQGDRCWRLESI